MPFARPTLTEIIQRVETSLASRLGISGALLRRSNAAVLAREIAGASHLQHGHLDYIADQIPADTADEENLTRIAGMYGVTFKAAAFAAGNVTFTGTNSTVIPQGTVLLRADGAEYTTDADGTISGGSVVVAITASVAGDAGNAVAATTLNLESPIAGVNSTATVDGSGITNGADRETVESLRSRLLARLREPPQGGSANDYEAWALEVAEVTRVWVYPQHLGVGTVGITFVLDDNESSIIPDGAKVTEVQDYIDARRPVTADVTVFAPTAVPLDLTIQLFLNTAAVQAAVTAELEDLLARDGEPGSTILLSRINEAISIADGEENHVLVIPSADVTHDPGEIPVLGTITWQSL